MKGMRLSLYALSVIAILAGASFAEDLPRYRCQHVSDAPAIDGRLDDAAWSAAERIQLVDVVSGEEPGQSGEAMMVWDDAALYIAFALADDDMWGTITADDGFLWNEEVVEVFIDPDADGENYAELEVSPNDVHVDLEIARPGSGDVGWNIAQLRTAVAATGTVNDRTDKDVGWNVEIAIPFSSLAEAIAGATAPPEAGDVWRINLYRIDRPAGGMDEYDAWSPTGKINFHMPEKFGCVEFETGERESGEAG